jgi:hypothetical protein
MAWVDAAPGGAADGGAADGGALGLGGVCAIEPGAPRANATKAVNAAEMIGILVITLSCY